MTGVLIGIGVALLLTLLGVAVKYSKAAWLIAGYNTSSKKQKERYDLDKLCSHVGNLLFVLGGISASVTLIGVLLPAHTGTIVSFGTIAFIIAALAGVIYLNTGRRVMKKPEDDQKH